MKRYPDDNSVLLLDNCRIHKCEELQEVLKSKGLYLSHACECWANIGIGCILKFIPPYSPDLNPIEESFSAGEETKNVWVLNTEREIPSEKLDPT